MIYLPKNYNVYRDIYFEMKVIRTNWAWKCIKARKIKKKITNFIKLFLFHSRIRINKNILSEGFLWNTGKFLSFMPNSPLCDKGKDAYVTNSYCRGDEVYKFSANVVIILYIILI